MRREEDGLPPGSLSGIGAVSLRTVKARLPKREACVKNVGSLAALFEGIRYRGCRPPNRKVYIGVSEFITTPSSVLSNSYVTGAIELPFGSLCL